MIMIRNVMMMIVLMMLDDDNVNNDLDDGNDCN